MITINIFKEIQPEASFLSTQKQIHFDTCLIRINQWLREHINPASIDMTGVGAYAAYLMGLEFIDEQSPV